MVCFVVGALTMRSCNMNKLRVQLKFEEIVCEIHWGLFIYRTEIKGGDNLHFSNVEINFE